MAWLLILVAGAGEVCRQASGFALAALEVSFNVSSTVLGFV